MTEMTEITAPPKTRHQPKYKGLYETARHEAENWERNYRQAVRWELAGAGLAFLLGLALGWWVRG